MMRRAFVFACLLSSFAAVAHAHGGLPVSLQIVFRDDQLIVPTRYWGVFFGRDGGPWRWICEEAINKNQRRIWALARSGAYHVTDFSGVTSSRDGGCTWEPATGEIATRAASHVIADPVEPARAWATTDAGSEAPWNALFTTADDGKSWTPVLQADEYLRGAALSSDGKTIYVTGMPRAAMGAPPTVLHVSRDGGKTWSMRSHDLLIEGSPARLRPLAVDPADATVVYLVSDTEPSRVLLRGDGEGAKLTEILRVQSDISEVHFDAQRQQILVATGDGIYRAAAGGTFARAGSLSRTQCITSRGGSYYACAWNYDPDLAAVARSDDGGSTWNKVFQYAETVGPTESCPAETPVAKICPAVWRMYASQLGIDVVPQPDGGTTPGDTQTGCNCAVAARRGGAPLAAVLVITTVGGLLFARRLRRRDRAANRGTRSWIS